MEVIAHIGARIAQARREKGLTEDQLAAATHFSVSLVRHFEQGTKPTSHAFTTAAARELGVQLGWLLGQEQVHRQHQEDDNTVAPALRARWTPTTIRSSRVTCARCRIWSRCSRAQNGCGAPVVTTG